MKLSITSFCSVLILSFSAMAEVSLQSNALPEDQVLKCQYTINEYAKDKANVRPTPDIPLNLAGATVPGETLEIPKTTIVLANGFILSLDGYGLFPFDFEGKRVQMSSWENDRAKILMDVTLSKKDGTVVGSTLVTSDAFKTPKVFKSLMAGSTIVSIHAPITNVEYLTKQAKGKKIADNEFTSVELDCQLSSSSQK